MFSPIIPQNHGGHKSALLGRQERIGRNLQLGACVGANARLAHTLRPTIYVAVA